jgi:gas vesicle protein
MKNRTVFSGIQMKWFAVLAGVFCLTMAASVSAEQNAKPCAEDAAKLCKGMQQGGGRMAQCLKEHSNELSPACKENMGKMKEKMQDFKQACKEDATKLCKDTKPGGGKIMQCLKQHEGELSAACKEKMAQPSGRQ